MGWSVGVLGIGRALFVILLRNHVLWVSLFNTIECERVTGDDPNSRAPVCTTPGVRTRWDTCAHSQRLRIQDMSPNSQLQRPTGAFVGASWAALLVGAITFLTGLWNSEMQLNEKGYYFAVLMYGLFSAVSLQKSVRDRLEGIPVTGIYFGLCWVSLGLCMLLLLLGLWNAKLVYSEKGFFAMAYLLSLFAAVTVQKNVRDIARATPADAASAPASPE